MADWVVTWINIIGILYLLYLAKRYFSLLDITADMKAEIDFLKKTVEQLQKKVILLEACDKERPADSSKTMRSIFKTKNKDE